MPTNQLDVLAERAMRERPRLFAVYGLRDHPDAPPVLGWGMEFTDRDDALFYVPDAPTTHTTVSAEHVVSRYSILGDMYLTWFDGPQTAPGVRTGSPAITAASRRRLS